MAQQVDPVGPGRPRKENIVEIGVLPRLDLLKMKRLVGGERQVPRPALVGGNAGEVVRQHQVEPFGVSQVRAQRVGVFGHPEDAASAEPRQLGADGFFHVLAIESEEEVVASRRLGRRNRVAILHGGHPLDLRATAEGIPHSQAEIMVRVLPLCVQEEDPPRGSRRS